MTLRTPLRNKFSIDALRSGRSSSHFEFAIRTRSPCSSRSKISAHTAKEYVGDAMRALLQAAKEDQLLFENTFECLDSPHWQASGMAMLLAAGLLQALAYGN